MSPAAALFRKAIRNDPHYAQAYVNLGLIRAQEGNYAGAMKEFREALALDPANKRARAALSMPKSQPDHGEKRARISEK